MGTLQPRLILRPWTLRQQPIPLMNIFSQLNSFLPPPPPPPILISDSSLSFVSKKIPGPHKLHVLYVAFPFPLLFFSVHLVHAFGNAIKK